MNKLIRALLVTTGLTMTVSHADAFEGLSCREIYNGTDVVTANGVCLRQCCWLSTGLAGLGASVTATGLSCGTASPATVPLALGSVGLVASGITILRGAEEGLSPALQRSNNRKIDSLIKAAYRFLDSGTADQELKDFAASYSGSVPDAPESGWLAKSLNFCGLGEKADDDKPENAEVSLVSRMLKELNEAGTGPVSACLITPMSDYDPYDNRSHFRYKTPEELSAEVSIKIREHAVRSPDPESYYDQQTGLVAY